MESRLARFAPIPISFSVRITTCVTLLVYATIFISSIILYEGVPKAPPPFQQLGLNLTTAMRDLQVVGLVILVLIPSAQFCPTDC